MSSDNLDFWQVVIKYLFFSFTSGNSCSLELFRFWNDFTIKLWQSCTCPHAGSLCGFTTKGKLELSKLSSYWMIFCGILQLMCNFHCVLMVDSNYRVLVVCEDTSFFNLRLLLIDDAVVESDSEKNLWFSTALLLLWIRLCRFWSSCIEPDCVPFSGKLWLKAFFLITAFFLLFFRSDLSYILFMRCNKIVTFFSS